MPVTSIPLLQVRDLRFAYAGQPALVQDWTASVGAGVTLLFGDTGSGKTTLLRVLAGALACAGQLSIAGIRLDQDAQAYRRAVFWFDAEAGSAAEAGAAARAALTPREWVAAWCAMHPHFDAAAWQRYAEGFGLGPHVHKPMYQLSTGSRRKVALAAALASGCPLTLLDEPTGALDAPSVAYLMHALAGCARRPDQAVVLASAERPPGVLLAGEIELPLPAAAVA